MGYEQWKHYRSDPFLDGFIAVASSRRTTNPVTTEHVARQIVDFPRWIVHTKGIHSWDSWLQRTQQHTDSMCETWVPGAVNRTQYDQATQTAGFARTWPQMVQWARVALTMWILIVLRSGERMKLVPWSTAGASKTSHIMYWDKFFITRSRER